MSDWQPFSTAPGRVLIVGADHARGYWAVGCLNAHGEFEETNKDGSPRGIGFYPSARLRSSTRPSRQRSRPVMARHASTLLMPN